MTGDNRFKQRAWYYTHVFADPKNPDVVYVLNTGSYRSIDGGKTFTALRTPHGDNHGFWIDPTNTRRMMNGNDGGANISTDGGIDVSDERNQPTAEIEHVSASNRLTEWVYGAQTGTWTPAHKRADAN